MRDSKIKLDWQRLTQKVFAILGIILLMVLNLGPFFEFLTFPQKVQANASTTWTKSGSNPVIDNTLAGYPRVIKVGSTYKMWMEAGTGNIKYAKSIEAEKDGYKNYESSEMIVETGKPVNLNIRMEKEGFSTIIMIIGIVLVSSVVGIGFYKYKKR